MNIIQFLLPASDVTISASFDAAPVSNMGYPVSVVSVANGSGVITVDGVQATTAKSGSTVRFTPAPEDHTYRFTGWASAMVAGLYSYSLTAQQLQSTSLDITMPAGAFELTPNNYEKYIYNVSVLSSTTTEEGSTETAASTATVSNASGNPITEAEKTSSITFTAIPGTYTDEEVEEQTYLFTGWTADGYTFTGTQAQTNPLTITMPNDDVELTASFIERPDGVRVGNIIWATTNVAKPGTFAETPYLYDYVFGVRNYRYSWNQTTGGIAGNTAAGYCPNSWRLPSLEEANALIAASSKVWKTIAGPEGDVNGTEATINATGEKLFFSASGNEYANGTQGLDLGVYGEYTTSNRSTYSADGHNNTMSVYKSGGLETTIYCQVSTHSSVRCVRDL